MRLAPVHSLVSIALFVLPSVALACANYSSSDLDDQAVRSALAGADEAAFRLVSRTFPHHGRAYWETLERESRERLSLGRSDKGSLGASDDLAVALLKQGHWVEARRLLLALDRATPNRYRTLSNLGVLEKKAGNYRVAASYLSRALELRPGGHMGLGDYYLRACRWQGGQKEGTPRDDFLGRPYVGGSAGRGSHGEVERLWLETLIHNDREFPDAYLVYGDLLLNEEPLLAGYAYAQARRLGHPAHKVLDQRLGKVRELLSLRSRLAMTEARRRGQPVDPEAAYSTLVSSAALEEILSHWLERNAGWSDRFERYQEGLLAGGTRAGTLAIVHSGLEGAPLGGDVAIPYLLEAPGRRPGVTLGTLRGHGLALSLLAGFLGVSLLLACAMGSRGGLTTGSLWCSASDAGP